MHKTAVNTVNTVLRNRWRLRVSYFLQNRMKSTPYVKAEQIHWINEKAQVAASDPRVSGDHNACPPTQRRPRLNIALMMLVPFLKPFKTDIP